MYIDIARRNLERAKIRSVLAVVGIFIGVMAVGAIGIFGESLKVAVMQNFEDVANEIVVYPNPQQGYSYVEDRDIRTIEKIPGVKSAIALRSDALSLEFKNKKIIATVYAMDEKNLKEMFEADKGSIKLSSGSCVVGKRLADFLSLKIGSKITLEGRELKVAAILKDVGARFDINPNFAVLVSEDDFKKISGSEVSMVIVKAESLEDVPEIKKAIEERINKKEEKLIVVEMKMILQTIENAFGQINLFLMAIAAISLLVAGVSILNIMLMSTIERTKEIGVMRAIGAQRSTILKIFITEAAILGLIGSMIGSALSLVGGILIDYAILQDWSYALQPSTVFYIILGLSVGISTAIFSGLYPAWKASKLEPIEALRYE
ncbi:MAG: ABC transporter permease [Archaeoglobales archaeon]|nr:ABC transporter permease [Archaeoglobales archaeon]